MNHEQRTTNNEQRTTNNEQRTTNNDTQIADHHKSAVIAELLLRTVEEQKAREARTRAIGMSSLAKGGHTSRVDLLP
ncbi:MAG: hypothetical protein Q8K18_10005 [Burkholderiales bacterium]|nr:hypothetical protein [Burkholderiales bacterium]